MTLNFVRLIVGSLLLVILSMAALSLPAHCQAGALAHFVAPTYPPLARSAMISGIVRFRVSVGPDGKLVDLKEEAAAHALLAQEARAAVQDWKFKEWSRSQSVGVSIFFSFSGTTRDSNPRTIIKADFTGSTIRVFVITDAAPTSHP